MEAMISCFFWCSARIFWEICSLKPQPWHQLCIFVGSSDKLLMHIWTLFYFLSWYQIEIHFWVYDCQSSISMLVGQPCAYVTRTSNNRVISLGDLYCCLLPQCEALRTCRSRFLIATQEIYFLSFTCAIHEYDQRWTCAWIWIQILWHFNILMDVDVTIFPDLDSNFQIWNGINDFL